MPKQSVLIVDDDRTTASIMQLFLNGLGYSVAGVAYSAKKAIAIAEEVEPDLVLMDIKLDEGADGIDAALVISKHMDVPIIFVTAHSDRETLRRAKIVNPVGFINKPLRESDLKTTIEFAITRKPKETEKNLTDISLEKILARTYKLTPAEIRVVIKLIKYPELNSAANALNLALSTVRTHLKHIYQKTNTNSKLMLLREIATGPASEFMNQKYGENWAKVTGNHTSGSTIS